MSRILYLALSAIALIAPVCSSAELSVTGTSSSTSAAEISSVDPVVAQGNGFQIRHSELDQVLATASAEDPLQPLPADAEVDALEQLIEVQLVLQKATDAEKAQGLKEADDTIAGILRVQGPAVFQQRLQLTHMTQDQLRTMLAQENAAQKSLIRQTGVTVTDADVKKLWDTHPGAWDQPERAYIRELVLPTSWGSSSANRMSRDAIESRHQLIEDIEKKIRGGADFAALARQYNQDPMSKETGGEVTLRRDKMEFGNLAFSMKPGQVSDVLNNSDGFRIFQLLNFVPPKKADFATLAPRLKTGLIMDLRRERAPQYIAQLRKQADIQILDPELKAKVAAADARIAQLTQALAKPGAAPQTAGASPAGAQ
jgi:peptidyl-prolyl cis-trans isomerase C